ncbi:MAG: DUF2576 domain-containing protein [Ruminococcaceae bacterium]|nr:DUF2576 domain-containing protein [Oscillospiraceae bacterium]
MGCRLLRRNASDLCSRSGQSF